MKQLIVAVALLLSFSACAREAESYEDPQGIVRALADSDIACEGARVVEGSSLGEAGHDPLVERQATCSISDVDVTINTFDDVEDRDEWAAVGDLVGPTAYGPNWVVTSRSEAVIEDVAGALNGYEEL